MSTYKAVSLSSFDDCVEGQSVPRTGQTVRFKADEQALSDIRQALDLVEARSVTAEFELRPWGRNGYRLDGEVNADLSQACVVTLDPVDARIRETVSLKFLPPEDLSRHAERAGEGEAEDIEPLESDSLPVGKVIRDTVSLALDPYPRAPGVEVPAMEQENDEEASPFAALRKLKRDE